MRHSSNPDEFPHQPPTQRRLGPRGDSSAVREELINVRGICSTEDAFAALLADGGRVLIHPFGLQSYLLFEGGTGGPGARVQSYRT